jgi:hypothetical protein
MQIHRPHNEKVPAKTEQTWRSRHFDSTMGSVQLKPIANHRLRFFGLGLGALCLFGTIIMACSHRLTVRGDDDICSDPLTQLNQFDDPRENYMVILPGDVIADSVIIDGANEIDSATLLNHARVSGLVLSQKSLGSTPIQSSEELLKRFSSALQKRDIGTIVVRASGTPGQAFDGAADVKETIWDISAGSPVDHRKLRNILLISSQTKSVALDEESGISESAAGQDLTVKLTLIQRDGVDSLSAAIFLRDEYDNPLLAVCHTADDIGNGSGLAPANTNILAKCDEGTIDKQPMADIIWVIDESDSMKDNRADIVNNAEKLFDLALKAGLDFRMGVTGVKRSDSGAIMGKFCSLASSEKDSDGGVDRFLRADERTLFSQCVSNPPYQEEDTEDGLTNAYAAVTGHLPRAENDPSKIRSEATLALIFVSDEIAHELKYSGSFQGKSGFINPEDFRSSCQLGEDKDLQMDLFLHPILSLFEGHTDPEAKAMVQVIGGTCNNTCKAEVAHGYRELAYALAGQVGDICQENLGATLQVMVNSIVATASPRVLAYPPISSTLKVALNGTRLNRGHPKSNAAESTYVFNAASNSLSLLNTETHKGDQLIASYRHFDD